MHLRLVEMAVRKSILPAESECSVLELFIAGIEAFVGFETPHRHKTLSRKIMARLPKARFVLVFRRCGPRADMDPGGSGRAIHYRTEVSHVGPA